MGTGEGATVISILEGKRMFAPSMARMQDVGNRVSQQWTAQCAHKCGSQQKQLRVEEVYIKGGFVLPGPSRVQERGNKAYGPRLAGKFKSIFPF